ncbi:MAG TPA: FAD-dependent oxidoreductase [Nitrososphaeraceae archaeon]|nr:FAD-dependent oxidoreductase [Nitrososphaeraceae archaeon]
MNSFEEPKQKEKEENFWENITSGSNESSWYANIEEPIKSSKLTYNIPSSSSGEPVDVAIIGGGIAGLTTAYLLSKSGKKVAVIEDGYIGSGETGRTTAHITHALDDRYYNLEQKHGLDGARNAADSHTAAINLIESTVKEENIDCDFERLDGFLFLDPTDRKESLNKELEATHRAGITTTEIVEKAPPQSFDTGPCIRFPNQAQFQPLKYLRGLYNSLSSNKVQIFTETHAQKVNSDNIETADGYTVKTRNIVIATNAPIIDKTSKIYDKQDAYRTYVIGARIKKGAVPTALYWDTGNQNSENLVAPYHYVRIQKMDNYNNKNYDLLIVGGEDHQTGNISSPEGIEKRYSELESWTRDRFPIEEIEYKWSGQVMEPQDSIAFIGHNPGDNGNNIYIATGDSGNGITHGTIAGILLTDLILGKNNPWTALYDSSRMPRQKPGAKFEEGGEAQFQEAEKSSDQYKQENDKKSPSEGEEKAASIESLTEIQGMVLEEKKIAVYKDHKGHLHTYSAVCTHLGCTVTWNNSEKSFDCPCHGSRFSPTGNVINGPANTPLEHKQVQ